MTQKLTTLLTGAVGAGASEIAQNINIDNINEGASLVTQIIILVATLIGLFKKKKA